MDVKLKRRLVGGAVLVLLAVIFLPMLFEDALNRSPGFEETLPEPPPPGELPRISVVPSGPNLPLASAWAVQLGSFSQVDNARRLEAELRDAGFPAFVDAMKTPQGAMYRVRVGPVLDKNEATRLAARIRERVGMKGFVVSHPDNPVR